MNLSKILEQKAGIGYRYYKSGLGTCSQKIRISTFSYIQPVPLYLLFTSGMNHFNSGAMHICIRQTHYQLIDVSVRLKQWL